MARTAAQPYAACPERVEWVMHPTGTPGWGWDPEKHELWIWTREDGFEASLSRYGRYARESYLVLAEGCARIHTPPWGYTAAMAVEEGL